MTPIQQWLVRNVADQLLHNRRFSIEENSTWLYATPGLLTDVPHRILKRNAAIEYFETTPVSHSAKRPLVLDWKHYDGEVFDLIGIGLMPVAVDWLVSERYVPAVYRRAIDGSNFDDHLSTYPEFINWRDRYWIRSPEYPPVPVPRRRARR